MSRLFLTVPLAGSLLLAIGASAPGVVGDLAAGRGTWRVAYEVRPDVPHCWSVPLLSYCRVDYEETVRGSVDRRSIHFLMSEPFPARVSLVRTDRLWGRVTAVAALDRLRARSAIVMGLLGLLGLVVWRMLVVGARQFVPEGDLGARMQAAGWRANMPGAEEGAAPRAESRGATQPRFGRRH